MMDTDPTAPDGGSNNNNGGAEGQGGQAPQASPLETQHAVLWDMVQQLQADTFAEKERRVTRDREISDNFKALMDAIQGMKGGPSKGAPSDGQSSGAQATPSSTGQTTPLSTDATTAPAKATTPVEAKPGPQLRPTLPHVGEFGGDRRGYSVWRAQLVAKLLVDGVALGGAVAHYHYIYTRLKPPTQLLVKTFYESQPKESQTPEHFLWYLDLKFTDPNEKLRARDRLWTTRQGPKESCAAFLVRFETILYESGLGELSGNGSSTITWLKGAINERLAEAMIHQPPTEDYHVYKNQLFYVSSSLEGLKYRQRGGMGAYTQSATAPVDSDAMDLRAGKTFPKDAARPDKRECYNCHKTGHIRRNCPDKKRDVKVNAAVPLTEGELEAMGAGEAVPGDGQDMEPLSEN